ncbi:putative F-box protein At3g10430 [Salvia miltiorrhiza]|uniref:putative F-box protein At3g10430 n=1 Tax=Salvia miltiorrhiza TaxID=226208 RepID=UPI0025AD732A|nr:putative F-box protein At3g10430 [Salvia miltiorrhiza]
MEMEECQVSVTRFSGTPNGSQYLKAIRLNGDEVYDFFIDMSFMGELEYENYIQTSYCDGIFCFKDFNGRIALCDPRANTVKLLPPILPAPPSSQIVVYNCGFGYDFSSDDYKVIRIYDVVKYDIKDFDRYLGATEKCEVFSFKSKSWKEIEYEGCSFICNHGGYALVGCSYHWLAIDFILAFDFSEEKFSHIPLPLSFKEKSFNGNTPACHVVVTPNSRLGVIFYSKVGVSKTFQVWEYGINAEWSQLYNDARLDNVHRPLNLTGSLMYVSRFTAEKGFLQLLVYDWVEGTLNELDIYDHEYVMGICTTMPSSNPPMLQDSKRINGQSAQEWDACWSRELRKAMKEG